MLVIRTTELGKLWHKWVTDMISLYGESWIHNVPRSLLGQPAPTDWEKVSKKLKAKILLFEFVDKEPLAIKPDFNGLHLHALFDDIQTKYWARKNKSNEVADISYKIFMECLEEGSITIAEDNIKVVT